MRILLLGLFIFSFSGLAKASPSEAMTAYRNETGGITLTGENCDLLKRHLSALASWKSLLQENPRRSQESCVCDSFKCYMGIDAVAPDFVETYQGVDAGRWGPNCWNTALVANKILPVLRFTPQEEMSFWMDSPLCKAVPEDEEPQPGDIIAIRDHTATKEVHAFTYVTDELAFSKNYLTTMAPYRLQASSEIYTIFPVAFACRQRVGAPANCFTYSNTFRCSSLQSYIDSHHVTMSADYSKVDDEVLKQEKIVNQIVFQWKTNLPLQKMSPQLLEEAKNSVKVLKRQIELQMINKKNTPDQKLLWKSLFFRIDGLLHSIDWI